LLEVSKNQNAWTQTKGLDMSINLEKYDLLFRDVFSLTQNQLDSTLLYQSVPGWDSVGHMEMISRLEESFEINMEMDDVIDFSSYEEGKKILSKYGINFDL
jgi:acyl carrier protein